LKSIVYTRTDGGVSVCTPSLTALRFMCLGGGRWASPQRGFLDRQIAEQAKYGVGERAAQRFVMALHKGGCSSSEAFEIMRDRYCAHLGTGCELWDSADVPQNRRHRNAWRRSHNGGPIWIDETLAQQIDEARMWAAYLQLSPNEGAR
jgi:hypothetical protein